MDIINGDVTFDSVDHWVKGVGRDTIDSSFPTNDGFRDLLSFFGNFDDSDPFTDEDAVKCFPVPPYPIFVGGIGPGKKGKAEAQFWFDAFTFDESGTTLLYQLRFLGDFDNRDLWLPSTGATSFLNMDEWRLTATNEGQEIKSISCIGEGTGVCTMPHRINPNGQSPDSV